CARPLSPAPLEPWYRRRPAAVPPRRAQRSAALRGSGRDEVVYGPLVPDDAMRCAELERVLFADDGPWPAPAFLSEIGSRHTTCLAARAGGELVGYAVLAALGPAGAAAALPARARRPPPHLPRRPGRRGAGRVRGPRRAGPGRGPRVRGPHDRRRPGRAGARDRTGVVGQAPRGGRRRGGARGAGRPDGQRPRRGPVYGTRVRGGGAAAPLLPSEHGRRPSHGAAGPRRVPARGRGIGERRVRTVMGIESSC